MGKLTQVGGAGEAGDEIDYSVIDLVGRIYGAVTEPARWQGVLDELAAIFEPLSAENDTAWAWQSGPPHSSTEDAGASSPPSEALPVPWPPRVDDWPLQVGSAALGADRAGERLTLPLAAHAAFRRRGNEKLARALLAHFFNAVSLHHQRLALVERRQTACGVLDDLSIAYFLTDANGCLRSLSEAARAICARAELIECSRAQIRWRSGRLQASFQRAVQSLLSGPVDDRHRCATLELESGSGPARLLVLLSALPDAVPWSPIVAAPRLAVGFLCNPASRRNLNLASLRTEFGISRTELNVLLLLINGDDVKTIARKLSRTESVIRQHVKRLFLKTGTHRQSALVQKILNSSSAVFPLTSMHTHER